MVRFRPKSESSREVLKCQAPVFASFVASALPDAVIIASSLSNMPIVFVSRLQLLSASNPIKN